MRGPKTLAQIIDADLTRFRAGRPLTGVAGAVVTLVSGAVKVTFLMVFSMLAATVGFVLTQSGGGAIVFALLPLFIAFLLRKPDPLKVWRDALRSDGFDVSIIDGGTEIETRVGGRVTMTYRFAPGDDARESLQLYCTPPLPFDLTGVVRTVRLRPPTFDGDLEVLASPAQLACFTGPVRAALSAMARPIEFREASLTFALDAGAFDVPADDLDALVEALADLATDMANPTPALLRISAGGDGGAALFDAARASALLLADGVAPRATSDVLAAVRACMAGDFEALRAAPCDWGPRAIICRGVFRAGGLSEVAVDQLCAGAKTLPDTEEGCINAIGVLGALASPAARARFERLGEVGTLSAARWLGDAQFPTEHGLQDAADAARAAIHQRLHVHGALSIDERDAAGGVSMLDPGDTDRG